MKTNWIPVLLAGVVAMLTQSKALAQAPSNDRPNFIFIYTDDQRYDALSCVAQELGEKARFPWFKTPNMDRLAKEGLRFRNAFVVNSLCSPSRACFLSGEYNHLNGVVNNHTHFPAENVSHATVLRQAGYITAYFGKFHHDNQKERPGFDVVESFIGQGNYENQPFNFNGTIKPTSGWVDDVTTDLAIDFLKERAADHKNFDVVIGFKSPHDPRHPPERAKERFEGDQPRDVPNMDVASAYRSKVQTTQYVKGHYRQYFTQYFRCISAVDDDLGKLLDAMDQLKLTENTVVVFTSDNGYQFGEHMLGDKRSAYEESLRIPMLVRYPKLIKPGSVSDEMALNIDYAPTIVDLAGAQVPDSMQGKSWKTLFSNPSAPLRDAFFYEYFYERNYDIPTMTAVRSRDAKLIKYLGHDDWTELYDLAKDPYEINNLAQQASAKDLMDQMAKLYDQEEKTVKFTIPSNVDKPPAKQTH